MATFRQNGIQFTATQGGLRPLGKLSKGANGDFSDAGTDGVSSFINAVEIDWNAAVLPDSNITTGSQVTINTTGELLNLVNEMQKEIYVLSAAVIALSGSL